MEPIIGIDLGTTNSEVAVVRNGRVEIVEESGKAMVPSYVGLSPEGELLVGEMARNQYVLYPEKTIKSIKRKMGSDEKVALGDRQYTPQEISAMILRELKGRAERALGRAVSKAVITVPAYFNDAQRQATRDAGTIAGLEVLRIVNEPTAACLAYEQDESSQRRTVLAFDLGGGTFDVSIVRMEGEMVEVVAGHGDNELGGDDVDELLYDEIVTRFYEETGDEKGALNSVSLNRLRRAAETAKIHLSGAASAKVIEDNLEDSASGIHQLQQRYTRKDFEELTGTLLRRTLASVHQAMASAGVSAADIDDVLLVGGSTRIPAVQDMLRKELKQKPRSDVHPDLAVAYGAGVMAARLMGEDNHRILIDITPYTFGTSCLGMLDGEMVPHLFIPIVESGTPLPVGRGQVFYTAVDGQEAVRINVFQGENRDARKNYFIGEFMVEGLDEDAPEGSQILINMNLDLDGLLTVTAEEKETGLRKSVTLQNTLNRLDESQLSDSQSKISELFGAGEFTFVDDEESEEIADCPYRNYSSRVAKSRGQMDEVDVEDVEVQLKALKKAVESGDKETAEEAIREIEDILFYVESGE